MYNQSNMYNTDIHTDREAEREAHILVVVGDSNGLASRNQLVSHDLSHRVLIIREGQVKVGHISVIMLQKHAHTHAHTHIGFVAVVEKNKNNIST